MKIIHLLVGAVLVLVFVAAGAAVLGAAATAQGWNSLAGEVAANRMIAGFAVVGVFCLLAVYGLSAIPVRRRERFLSFDGENGRVSISTNAICNYVGKLVEEFPSVVSMRPTVVPGRRAIDLVIHVRVKPGPQIHEVCEVLQKRAREVMASGLGICEVRRVEVKVREISTEHKAG